MAPIFSKFIKLKSGHKIPINDSNRKAIVKLIQPTKSKKIPVKFVPKPGQHRDLSSNNDSELQQLLDEAESRRSAREMSERNQNPNEVHPNRPDIDPNQPENDQNQPDNGHNQADNGQNDPQDDWDELLEPNLDLSDITLAQRAEILLFPGTDKCKRRQFYLKYYPNFYHYYESLDCWDECPIKSRLFTFFGDSEVERLKIGSRSEIGSRNEIGSRKIIDVFQ